MDRIKAKQVEGAMDLNTDQTVSGTKTFNGSVQFIGGTQTMVAHQNNLYWCQSPGVLEEPGNSRLRAEGGTLIVESFNGDAWVTA